MCHPCGYKGKYQSSFNKHLTTQVHKVITTDSSYLNSEESKAQKAWNLNTKTFICSHCKESFSSHHIDRFYNHKCTPTAAEYFDETMKSYQCKLCDYSPTHDTYFLNIHLTSELHTILTADISDLNPAQIKARAAWDTKVKMFICPDCNRSFNKQNVNFFYNHTCDSTITEYFDETMKSYQCKACEYHEKHQGPFKIHLKSVLHKVLTADISDLNPAQIKARIAWDINTKMFVCPDCNRSFDKQNINFFYNHTCDSTITEYFNESTSKCFNAKTKRYQCSLCDSNFRSRQGLIRHQKIGKHKTLTLIEKEPSLALILAEKNKPTDYHIPAHSINSDNLNSSCGEDIMIEKDIQNIDSLNSYINSSILQAPTPYDHNELLDEFLNALAK